jgi:hypothetical protein
MVRAPGQPILPLNWQQSACRRRLSAGPLDAAAAACLGFARISYDAADIGKRDHLAFATSAAVPACLQLPSHAAYSPFRLLRCDGCN